MNYLTFRQLGAGTKIIFSKVRKDCPKTTNPELIGEKDVIQALETVVSAISGLSCLSDLDSI